MPRVCVVYGCTNRSSREKNKRYFRVPKAQTNSKKEISQKRRKIWLKHLNLKSGGAESVHARVCSDHFVKGCPSALEDVDSIDWAPTVNLGYQMPPDSARKQPRRMNTKETAAMALVDLGKGSQTPGVLLDVSKCSQTPAVLLDFSKGLQTPGVLLDFSKCSQTPEMRQDLVEGSERPETKDAGCQTGLTMDDGGCQTDLTMGFLRKMEDVLNQSTEELICLRTKVLDTQFSQEAFQKNEVKTKFYTGLPNFSVLMQLFELCEPSITTSSVSALSKFEQLILVLMRLKLNLHIQDLAFRFKVSCATVSRIWHKLIVILQERLEFIIECPEHEVLQDTVPMSFRQVFGAPPAGCDAGIQGQLMQRGKLKQPWMSQLLTAIRSSITPGDGGASKAGARRSAAAEGAIVE